MKIWNAKENENSSKKVDDSVDDECHAGSEVALEVEVGLCVQESENSGREGDEREALRSQRLGHHLGGHGKAEAAEADVEEEEVDDQGDRRYPQRRRTLIICGNVDKL